MDDTDWKAKYQKEHNQKKKLNKRNKKNYKKIKRLTKTNKSLKLKINKLQSKAFINERDYF